MLVYVVRHACAGDKASWTGDDALRPLDSTGVRQAEALANLLSRHPVRRILSSPARRCVQTVAPLAARAGLPVVQTSSLRRDIELAEVIRLVLNPTNEGAVLCTHGEVMRPLLAWLRHMDVSLVAGADDEALMAKGTVWAVELGVRHPRLSHLVPPGQRPCSKCSSLVGTS